ncbi:Integrase catalytic domain-containing protein [Citrus sinensis]|nr:Integrase catalytic domain-containing protein [Citrus sinensis]
MVEGETSKIGERSTETISGDTSGGRQDLSNRYSEPVIGGQKIDVEKFDGKINFGMWRREVMDALIQIDLDVVLKNKRHLYDEEIWDRMNEKTCALTNLEIRNNDKNSERASSEALVSRDWAMEKQKKNGGKNSRSKSRSRNIARDECAFCHEKGHWRKYCPKAQKRDEKKPAAANMARKDEGYDYSLSITHAAYVASSSEWMLDTGATYHLCPIKEWFTDFRNLESDAVMMRNDKPCRTMGIRTIRLKMFDGIVRELKEVRFVPTLKKNLISVGALEAKGYKVTIEDGTMKFTHGAKVILQGVWRHNLYYLKGVFTNSDEARTLKRRVWVYTMRAKDEVLEIFVKWKKLVETQTGRKIKVLRYDNEGEYTSDPFLQVCQNEGIKRHFTVRHTLQQNGVAERMNRTLLEKVWCMLSNAGLDKKFWAESVNYASHLVNRLPSAAIGGKTLMEMWSGKYAQDYDSLRIFGCPSYYHVKDGKLDSRATKTIFVGFKGGVKGFKLWDLEDKKFMCSKDVTFDEASMIEASMIKASSSQQLKTHRVEEEVVSSDVPQNEETIDDVDNDDFIATRRPRREIKKPGWLTKDMMVAYALPVIDDDIPNTFVVKHTSIRILLALVAEYELDLAQLDVKTAFLHGDLEEEIYMIQPCGFRVAGKENHIPDGAFIYLLLYVDDMLIASKNRDEIERLKKQLASKFEMKDLGDAQRILGMEIRRDKKNGSVWLTQKSYLKKVLERFSMDDKTKPVCTPLAPHFKLSSSSCPISQEERDYMARVPYASAVGSLMYAMVCTRPDISQAVSMVSRYMHNPGKNQWLVVKWILRYLYETIDVGLLFKKDCCQQCVGYCDSDFVGDLDKRISTTGHVFTLGGGPVSWRSILQSTIALSTMEAEYMAATEVVKEAIWLKGLLGDLGVI